MSLDLSMYCPCCGAEATWWNYTYNVSCMWREVFPGERMIDIDGMTGKEALPKLQKFVKALEDEPEKFKAMDASNGWGTYESFLPAVRELVDACVKHPELKWESCR